jgi:LPXTG-motif cell wall-anchored protein
MNLRGEFIMKKKAKRSLFLCFLCLLIALPNSAFANSSSSAEETTLQTQTVEIENSSPPAEEIPQVGSTDGIDGEILTDNNSSEAIEPPSEPVTDIQSEASSDSDQNALNEMTIPETKPSIQEPQTRTVSGIETELPDPEILNVQFEPKNAKVGDTVKITANIKDDGALIDGVYAYLYPTNIDEDEGAFFESRSVRLRYDAVNKQWTGFFIVQETWHPGSWEASIYAENNQDYYSYDEYYEESAFTIQNEGNYLSPKIGDVEVTPNPAIAGGQVTFAVTIDDLNPGDTSKIVYALLTLNNYDIPDFYGIEMLEYDQFQLERFIPLTFDPDSNKWTGTMTIPVSIPDGTYVEYSILASDITGNLSEKWDYETNYFIVSNPDEVLYTTPPELLSLEINRENFASGDKVEVIANVKDNVPGGVKSVSVDLDWGIKETELTYDENDQLWKGTIDLSYLQEGYYYIHLYALDIHGNDRYFYTEKSIYVSNDKSDWSEPVIGTIKVMPDTVKVGDEIKISVPVDDGEFGTGVRSVTAYIEYPSIYRYDEIVLTYNDQSKEWEGTYRVEENDPEGYLEIEIEALDNAENYAYEEFIIMLDNIWDDILQPYIDFVKYPPATNYLGEIAHFEAQLVDEQSGIKSAKVTLYDVKDLYYYYDFFFENKNTISFDLVNREGNVWEADYIIPPDVSTGLYLVNITVFDFAGNKWDVLMNEYFENVPQTMVILENRSDSFAKALYHFNKKDFYEAVYHAGETIKAGDTHEKVKDLMSNAAVALLGQASKMSGTEASKAYELLINTMGVPEDIVSSARVKLKTLDEDYEEATIDEIDLTGKVPNSLGEIEMDYTNIDGGSLAYFVSNEKFKAFLQANPDVKFIKTNLANLQVIMPTGNLPTDQSFTIIVLKDTLKHEGAISDVFDLFIQKADGSLVTNFSTPVTLKFIIDPQRVKNWDDVKVAYIGDDGKIIEYITPKAINKETGEITVEVSHFSKYAVVETASTGAANKNIATGTNQYSGNNQLPKTATNTYNILLFGMLLLTAGGLSIIFRKEKIGS